MVYVRTDGDNWQCNGLVNDPYPGGIGPLPCAVQSFWRAHEIVDTAGVVYMAAGTYPEGITIAKELTVYGAGVDQTIIDLGGTASRGISISYISPAPPPTVTISGLTVQNAVLTGPSGGVLNGGATVTLDSCAIRNNSASGGAGVQNGPDGVLLISKCVIEGNISTSGTGGGGIYNQGSLYLVDTFIRDNHVDYAGASGGGLLNANSITDEVVIYRSTFSGNSAEQFGSAIHDLGQGAVSIVNSTVSANTVNAAFGPGDGAIFITSNSSLEILFSTIAGNFANGVGVEGGIVADGPVTVSSSIIAWNDNADCLFTGGGSITSEGNNIDSGTDCGFTSSGDMQNTDPLLGALADNGGPTWTMALLPGSPAIDSAGDPACADPRVDDIDQRGVARPIGAACDIGAFESMVTLFLPVIHR
jgi:hypothetical protein